MCFVSLDGIEYRYCVTTVIEIDENDHQELAQGEWELTLLTCNNDGSRRVVVRCQELPA